LARFAAEFRDLSPVQRAAFMTAVMAFVADMNSGATLRPSLRVKRVVSHQGVWEMTWATDGRATFEYGEPVIPGQPHIIWRRIGKHDIFRNP
jgi:hypothetical protein